MKKYVAFTDQALSSLLNFILMIWLANELGAVEYGKFMLVYSVAQMIISINASITNIPAVLYLASSKNNLGYYKYALFKFSILIFIFLILYFAFSFFINIECDILPSIVFCVGFTFYDFIKGLLNSGANHNLSLALNLVLIATISNFYLNNIDYDYVTAIGCIYGFCGLVFMVFLTIGSQRQIKEKFYYTQVWESEKKSLLKLLAASKIQFFNSKYLFFLLGYLAGPLAVATLSVHMTIIGIVNPIISTLDNYLFPKVMSMKIDGSNIDKYLKIQTLNVAIVISFVHILVISNVNMISELLYSGKYEISPLTLLILAGAVFFNILTKRSAFIFYIERLEGLLVREYALQFLCSLLYGTLLIYLFSSIGYSFSILLSSMFVFFRLYIKRNKYE